MIAKADGDERYMTLYADQQADVRDIATQLNRLKAAFPRNEAVFFNILAERVVAKAMTRSQLTEAVNRLIDGFLCGIGKLLLRCKYGATTLP